MNQKFLFEINHIVNSMRILDLLDIGWTAAAIGIEVHLHIKPCVFVDMELYPDVYKKISSAELFGISKIYYEGDIDVIKNLSVDGNYFSDSFYNIISNDKPSKKDYKHVFSF